MSERPSIGIIGDGNVGSALAKGLGRSGYEVEAIGNEPERVRQLAQDSEIVILAVPSGALREALRECGDLSGKVVVDVSNTLDENMGFAGDPEQSNAERVQEWAEGAQVVKCFNTVFAQTMSEGEVHGEPLTVFCAADEDAAKQEVLQLARDIGFDAVDVGPLKNARFLENLGFLNIHLGYGQKLGPDAGFRYVHKESVKRGQSESAKPRRARAGRGARTGATPKPKTARARKAS